MTHSTFLAYCYLSSDELALKALQMFGSKARFQ